MTFKKLNFLILLFAGFQYTVYGQPEKKAIPSPEIYEDLSRKMDSMLYTNIDSSMFYGQKLLELSLLHADSAFIAEAYVGIGYTHFYKNQLEKALKYFQKAGSIQMVMKDSMALSGLYMNYGNAYTEMGFYEKGVDAYQKAEEIILQSEDSSYTLAYLYYNTAETFLDLNDLDNAQKYIEKSRVFSQRDSLYDLLYAIKNIKADILIRKNQLVQARSLATQALKEGILYHDMLEQVYGLRNLASIDAKLQNYDSAFVKRRRALDLAKRYGDPTLIASESALLAQAYIKLDQHQKGLDMAEIAYELADSLNSKILIKQTAEIFAKALEENGDYKKALEMYKIYYAYTDSINQINISERLLRSQNELNQQKYDLAAARSAYQWQENRKNKMMLISISGALLGCIILMFIMKSNLRRKKKTHKLLTEKQIEIDKKSRELKRKNEELKMLNNGKDKLFSILTHDIKQPFNQTLGVLEILNLYDIEDDGLKMLINQVKESTMSTKSTVDNLLTWSKAQFMQIKTNPSDVSVALIAARVNDELKSIITEKSLSTDISIDPEIKVKADPHHLEIIIRNLLQNAIKFSNHGGRVKISVCKQDENVEITISDEGLGMTAQQLRSLFDINTHFSTPGTLNEKGTGLGMIIVHDFVIENKGLLKVESQLNEGSTFRIILPAA